MVTNTVPPPARPQPKKRPMVKTIAPAPDLLRVKVLPRNEAEKAELGPAIPPPKPASETYNSSPRPNIKTLEAKKPQVSAQAGVQIKQPVRVPTDFMPTKEDLAAQEERFDRYKKHEPKTVAIKEAEQPAKPKTLSPADAPVSDLVMKFRSSPLYDSITKMNLLTYEAQLSRMNPPSIELIITLGDTQIAKAGSTVTKVNEIVKTFAVVNGNELLGETLKLLTTSQKQTFFSRFNKRKLSINDQKAKISALKQQLLSWLPQCTQHINTLNDVTEPLMVYAEMLAIVADKYESSQNLEQAFYNKRLVFQQSIVSIETTKLHIKNIENTIGDLLVKAEHLLNVLIPAYEQANSGP